jgi:hypothetical protein
VGSRDHSYLCAWCDEERGGMDNITCACDRLRGFRCGDYTVGDALDALGLRRMEPDLRDEMRSTVTARRLDRLAANLATAGALCASFGGGVRFGYAAGWHPGCGRPMPGRGGGE